MIKMSSCRWADILHEIQGEFLLTSAIFYYSLKITRPHPSVQPSSLYHVNQEMRLLAILEYPGPT